MTRLFRLAVLAAAAVALTGCGALGERFFSEPVLTNLQGCERNYSGVVSAGLGAGFSGSVQIHCPAPVPAPAKAAEPAAEAED